MNAGQGRSQGVEFGARQWLTSWLQFRASYTWTRAIITRNPAEPLTEGKFVPYFPRHMTGGSLIGSRRRWTGSLTARYAGAMFATDTNTDVVKGVPGSFDPFFVADFNLGFQISRRLQIYGGLDNMLDRRFYQQYRDAGRLASIGLRFRM
jgi:iron complex outermembrane receptor protein